MYKKGRFLSHLLFYYFVLSTIPILIFSNYKCKTIEKMRLSFLLAVTLALFIATGCDCDRAYRPIPTPPPPPPPRRGRVGRVGRAGIN
jgi:hypothetical protein